MLGNGDFLELGSPQISAIMPEMGDNYLSAK
jgi:hypothetical protein